MRAIAQSRAKAARALGAALLLLPVAAFAAPIERNPAPTGTTSAPVQLTAPPNVTPETADPTPIAGALRAVRFLGPETAVRAPGKISAGVDTGALATLDDPAFRARIAPYLGQPISMRLIGRIEAAVAGWYAERGLPFVSVTTPPQEVTGGVLQFRVTEFRLGTRRAQTTGQMTQAEALTGIRAQPGQAINTDQLAEDLDWLSRSPFRDVDARFAPGAETGQTDLTLSVTETKPWQLSAQVDNSGARSTGTNRVQLGAMVGDFWRPGAVLSYAFTASPDAFQKGAMPFGGHPDYASHALSLHLPTVPRQAIEARFDVVESNSYSFPFDTRSRVLEGQIGYRFAASALGLKPGSGDLYGGIEMRHALAQTRFGGTKVSDLTADVAQLYLGWSRERIADGAKTSARVEMRLSPGGMGGDNSDADFAAYSGGRVTTSRYAYAAVSLSRSMPIGKTARLTSGVSMQLASAALLDTEQFTLGGAGAVRGYIPDDGAFDSAAIWRNTLSGATMPVGKSIALTPYLSADLGYGRDRGTGSGQGMASVGAGAWIALPHNVNASLGAAVALRDADITQAGDLRVEFKLSAGF
ncbi:ShlB/FhaC/HecB family hemolysin secretion/activation protein [Thioclava pacifica]|uniref:ShlB/FhaC/HecB family hemolysin secretion/activation protein n=1 Tax=Thioclava pacifica TaxID=285109 RepID=UPI00146FC875|nr:ShlB/FhaC/HecB family hemolysin secretion/activation protein [Thioclava pacifica]